MTRIPVVFPAGWVTPAMIETPGAGGGIDSGDIIHHFPIAAVICDEVTPVASTTKLIYVIRGSYALLTQFSAMVKTVATGSDRVITIDLKRTRAGTQTSVLSAPIQFTSSSTALTLITATLASTKAQPGDIFEIVIGETGSASAEALGLTCWMWLEESET